MFETLSERLQKAVSNIKSKGVINEENISEIVREIRLCLLEADVNVKIVKEFIDRVKEKALGEEVRKSIKPGDMFVKILKDELVDLLGGDASPLELSKKPTIVMVVGLQGGGKTTTIGKIGNMVRKKEHKKPMFIAEGAGRGEEEGEGRRPAVREPEGEGLAARVPDSPAASRPRPAAACPVAEEEEKDKEEEEEGWGWAAAGGA